MRRSVHIRATSRVSFSETFMGAPMRRTRSGWLRPRGERPCGHSAAEERNELAPLHRADPNPMMVANIAGQGGASQQKRAAHVRFGSNSTDAVKPHDDLCPLFPRKRTK